MQKDMQTTVVAKLMSYIASRCLKQPQKT